jgi:hypothetical protein
MPWYGWQSTTINPYDSTICLVPLYPRLGIMATELLPSDRTTGMGIDIMS